MLKMSPIATSETQKLINLVDEFGGGDCGENKVRSTSALRKRPIKGDYPSFNHVSHAVSNFISNFAKNGSNYLTPDAKSAFNQLRQAFIEMPIFQNFNPKQYIRVETDAFGHAIDGVLSQLINDSVW